MVSNNQIQLLRNGSQIASFAASELSPDSTSELALYTRGTIPTTSLPSEVFALQVPSLNGVPLSYTRFGTYTKINVNIFNIGNSSINPLAAFVFGQPTDSGSMPVSGSASYNADLYGAVVIPDGLDTQFFTLGGGHGSATFNADFAGGLVNTLINLDADGRNFGSLTGNGSIASGGPAFNGSLTGSGSGSFTGAFFGPGAIEMGYVFQAEGSSGGSSYLTYGNVYGAVSAPPP